jgi:Mn2+/Fe2+ NRAMP family transporter
MLPNAQKPWAKKLATAVICVTIVALIVLAFILKTHNMLHISEIVGIFLLFLTIVPPNLAVIYPWLLPTKSISDHTHKSTLR